MQQQQRYHVKHVYSISTKYNQHLDQHPWYGAGQGTGDAAMRWVAQSHLLITAYHSKARLWQLSNPTNNDTILMGIDAFMDNTNQLLINDNSNLLRPLLPDAQANIDLWQGLIQSSGGTLNPNKCSWTPFLWEFDLLGNANLKEPPD